jgi:hypothetical protein
MWKLLVLAALLIVSPSSLPAQIVNLCHLAGESGAYGAHHVETPLAILGKVVVEAGWQLDEFQLVPTKDPQVSGNALAEVCREPLCNCIFYDPAFLSTSPSASADSWVAYYVLAHEAGHIIKPATGKTRLQKEAAADDWAGWAMERINAPIDAVLKGVDFVATSEDQTTDYKGRCQRRMDALAGYNRALALDGKPQLQACNSCSVVSSLVLYLTVDALKGAAIHAGMVANCGSAKTQDLPTDFNRDLRGACLLSDKKAGTVLTWDNVGVCSR